MCTARGCIEWQKKLAAAPLALPEEPMEWHEMIIEEDARLRTMAERLRLRQISVSEWRGEFEAMLLRIHTESHRIGQRLAGRLIVDEMDAQLAGRRMLDIETSFLNNFVYAIEDGEYLNELDELNDLRVYQRSRLYLGKSRGTGNQAFVDFSEDTEEFDWILGPEGDNCEDCPILAAGGPYTKETLYTTPGAGDTPCLGYCNCELKRRSDGASGIPPMSFATSEDLAA